MKLSREHIVTNGRAAFYACIWDNIRQVAISNGWALGLHGSLASDMDIMAMPWDENAVSEADFILSLMDVFTDNKRLQVSRTTNKPNNRIVYTFSIWADYYLDINIISTI